MDELELFNECVFFLICELFLEKGNSIDLAVLWIVELMSEETETSGQASPLEWRLLAYTISLLTSWLYAQGFALEKWPSFDNYWKLLVLIVLLFPTKAKTT